MMPWQRMMFRGLKVYAEVDEKGDKVCRNGLVRIKFKEKDDRTYSARAENVVPIDERKLIRRKGGRVEDNKSDLRFDPQSEIVIFTDGASAGNPGHAGIGILMLYKNHRRQISRYIGKTTGNYAELMAVKVALSVVKRRSLPVKLFVDSIYTEGILTRGWKPRANVQIVQEIKTMMRSFADLQITSIKGHCGIKENELVDSLAREAIKKR
jgi:ribonuclease HI